MQKHKSKFKRFSEEWFIEKYGKEEGIQKRNTWRKNCSGSLENFIRRHGEIEGKIRYEKFKQNCAMTEEHFVKKYGEIEGIKRYKSFNETRTSAKHNKFKLEYWKQIFDDDKKAQFAYKHFQGKTFNTYLKKYKDPIEAKIQYELYLENRMRNWNIRQSIVETNFYDLLVKTFPMIDFERSFRIGRYTVDVLYKQHIIDLFGDFWHANPIRYTTTDYIPFLKKSAAEIWAADEIRSSFFKTLGFKHLIIWESEFYYFKEQSLDKIKLFLLEEGIV